MQTAVAGRLIASVEEKYDADIECGSVSILPFKTLILKDIVLIDRSPLDDGMAPVRDTVLSASCISARFSLSGLLGGQGIRLGRVEMDGPHIALVTEPGEKYRSNVTRIFRLENKHKPDSGKDILSVRRVIIRGCRFTLDSHTTSPDKYGDGINWARLALDAADAELNNFKIKGKVISAELKHLSATERSGYSITDLSGKVRAGNGLGHIEGLHLSDPYSDLTLDHLTLQGDGQDALKSFLTDIHLDAEFEPGTLDFKTLAYFVPSLGGHSTIVRINSGNVNGTVSDLHIDGLEWAEALSSVSGEADLHISGLPTVSDLTLDCSLRNVRATVKGLSSLIGAWSKSTSLPDLAPGETFRFDGRAVGNLFSLKVKGELASGIGGASADLVVENLISKASPMSIKGRLATDNLDLSEILSKDFLGPCTLHTDVSATLTKGAPSVRIVSLEVDRLTALGYDYRSIEAAGTYSQNAFDGRIVCNDPNVNFMFQGRFNLSRQSENALYRFYAYLGYADLHALGIDSREVSRLSGGSVNANWRRVSKGDLVGTVDVSSITLEGADGRHGTGEVHIDSRTSGGRHDISLSSDFADGSYSGTGSIADFVRDLQDLTVRKELQALCGAVSKEWGSDSYTLGLDFHDSRDLLSFVAPGAYIADSTSLSLKVTPQGRLSGRLSSPRLAYKGKYIKGATMDVDNGGDALNLTLTGSSISLGRDILLESDAIMLYANDDSFGAGLTFSDAEELNRGEVYFTADLGASKPGAPALDIHTLASGICLDGEEWRIEPSTIRYDCGDLSVDRLRISSDDQMILVSGGFSPDKADTLSVTMDRIDLRLADILTDTDLGLEGLVSGQMALVSPSEEGLCLDASVVCSDAVVGGHPAGTLTISSATDKDAHSQRFDIRGLLDSRLWIAARGSYNLDSKDLALDAGLNRMEVGYAEPLMQSVFSQMTGALSGKISASGPLNALELSSSALRLDDGVLRVAYTDVPYNIGGTLHLDSSGAHFDSVSATDRYDGRGTITGGILYDHFKDIRMDTHIKMDGIEVLDTDEKDNSSFYGNVFGTGRMSITGPLSSLLLDIDASTVKQGHFHIPLSGVTSEGGKDLLTFKEAVKKVYVDPYDEMTMRLESSSKKAGELGVRLKVNANQNTEAHLEIDKSAGNVLTGRGEGNIALEVRPSKDIFTINGDYTLSSGGCHINILGITSKDFTIQEGSSIKFGGDIMDSELDIEARYNIKTSLSSLIADTTSVSTRRSVECAVNITDQLRNPQLDFAINVPDLDPATKSRVESALSTDDKVQKQFMALLVTGNFLPDDQSGIVNNTNILYSNVADIMAGQVNNILERLEIPLDLGLKYQESGSGTSIFDVALSTQLFNNRVSVGGNIGNRMQQSSGSEDVVGDLDIEIKMDRSGAVRLNLFSHSADEYTNYLDNSQRNGVGVAYQKEFNSLKSFLKELFTPAAKRQSQVDSGSAEKVTINIE